MMSMAIFGIGNNDTLEFRMRRLCFSRLTELEDELTTKEKGDNG